MTAGNSQDEAKLPSSPATADDLEEVVAKEHSLTRLVSEPALSAMTESGKSSPQYVSGCEDEEGNPITLGSQDFNRSDSPMRCVSEFDEVTGASKESQDGLDVSSPQDTQQSCNPLYCASFRSAHVRALRLEAELQPMRMILGRLMAHPANKKGLFNTPVDAVALGLADYHEVIKKPMDLGTIKARLYSIMYPSRQEAAEDICLVFQNAMLYNPPRHPVHVSARTLQSEFEDLFVAVGGDKKTLPLTVARPPVQNFSSRRVSFTQQPQTLGLKPLGGKSLARSGGKGIMRSVSSDVEASVGGPATQSSSVNVSIVPAAATADAPTSPSGEVSSADLCAPLSGEGAHISVPEGLFSVNSPLSGTRGRGSFASSCAPMGMKLERKRRLNYSGHRRTVQDHSCRFCLGRSCLLCEQNCLPLEATLLVCNGVSCAGAKIRKGSTYYIAKDGSRQYCQRCFTSLPPVLPPTTAEDEAVRYKRDLMKRQNLEELVEAWLTCNKCELGVHKMCALHNSFVHSDEDYTCPGCTSSTSANALTKDRDRESGRMYTFITGSENPLPLSEVTGGSHRLENEVFSAEALAETDVSAFIEAKVRERLKSCSGVPNADKTVTVRIVSDCDRSFKVPEVVRKHFRMATSADESADTVVTPPEKVNYKSKAIALFQKVDGLDVCIFCMYVQEYEGNDDYGEGLSPNEAQKRVYIAYLDSVEHFRPRSARTDLYHELLVSYLASARLRGFESAHIWACPPSRGNCFVFWNHPSSQRTPTQERLISWYNGALSRAIECGVVTDVKSLYESSFQGGTKESEKENQDSSAPLDPSGRMVCPPLLEGDFWIEEAVRIHTASLARHLKAKSSNEGKELSEFLPRGDWEPCPARQISSLLLDRVMAHTSAAPFRLPVNAASVNLKDYHKIITKPMDLGTVYTRCVHGEYPSLGELVADAKLVFANAKKFNPEGHFVHSMAVEMEELFFKELDHITKSWGANSRTWKDFSEMSMSLDMKLDLPEHTAPSNTDATADKDQAPGTETKVQTPTLEDLLVGGPDILSKRMAGEDMWMIEKRSNLPPKRPSVSKKGGGKRRRSSSISPLSEEEPSSKRRRQTWLGEEVGASVRSMRLSFFACSLVPTKTMTEKEQEKACAYADYAKCFQSSNSSPAKVIESHIADARSALLEFSQRRHLEFDTLRHAKYSTAVLLYHLHNHGAPGIIPICTSCKQETTDLRWHKLAKLEELRKTPHKRRRLSKTASETADDRLKYEPEELCSACHAKHSQKDQFIPLPVSFKSTP